MTFVSALSCNAQIGADQARDIAVRFFADNNLCNDAPRRKCARKDTMPKLVYTAKTYGKADYYVFHRDEQGNGFVIVNAHGTCEEPAVIGYAHEGSFDIDNIPPAFAWCLSQYQQCGIAWRSNGAAEKWRNVGPLLTTQWNQRKPFDGAIPVLDTDGKPFLTGCVATATAQIMKYHNCPQQGTGSNSYTFAYNDSHNGYTIGEFDADFSTTEYDWGNMLDIYDEGYSDTKVQTIGILVDGEEGIKTPSTSPRRGELLTPHPSTSPRGDSNDTYDLTGRVVSTTTIHRGVNIMNGMKVIR